jgi:hypothetical protein
MRCHPEDISVKFGWHRKRELTNMAVQRPYAGVVGIEPECSSQDSGKIIME